MTLQGLREGFLEEEVVVVVVVFNNSFGAHHSAPK